MPLNPIDYDADELREMADRGEDRYLSDGFLWPVSEEGDPMDVQAAFEESADDRPVEWGGSLEERQKPYLRTVPETTAADALARQWVERLTETAGFEGAVEALSYYESQGWLTENAEAELQDYLLGAGNGDGPGAAALTRDDHIRSLNVVITLSLLGDDD